MKRRNLFAVWLGLPIITLGIYGFVWIYKIHDELRRTYPNLQVTDPGTAILSVIFGGFTLGIWPLIVLLRFGTSLQQAQQQSGRQPTFSQGLGIVLTIFGFGPLYYQSNLNALAAAPYPVAPQQAAPLPPAY